MRAHRRTAIFVILMLIASGCASQINPIIDPDRASQHATLMETIDTSTEKFLSSMIEEERFSGAALVKRGDLIVHARAYGMANEIQNNSLDMAFHVGSITKQFTAAAILRLVQSGQISLSESLNTYLPENFRSDKWERVEIKHLLSHTSGIPDYGLERDYYAVIDGWPDAATMDGMVREATQAELEFSPGTDFNYSNIGYTILGLIISEVTGQPYEDFVETQILAPLGMENSKIHRLDHVALPNEPQGNRWNESEKRHTKDLVVTLPVTPADGGLITTLSDFLKWIEVYRSSAASVVSQDSISLMTKSAIPQGSYDWPEENIRGDATYGFGVTLSGDLIMHAGYIVGYRSYFIYSQSDDLLIVLFTNNTTNSPERMAKDLFELHDKTASFQSNASD